MRIVDRKAFLKMPAGTLFTKYASCHGAEPMVKGETISHVTPTTAGDFYYRDLLKGQPDAEDFNESVEKFSAMEADPKLELPNEKGYYRDGLFDEGQLFIIFSDEDRLVAANDVLPKGYFITKDTSCS
jgi:hypothetical protein